MSMSTIQAHKHTNQNTTYNKLYLVIEDGRLGLLIFRNMNAACWGRGFELNQSCFVQ